MKRITQYLITFLVVYFITGALGFMFIDGFPFIEKTTSVKGSPFTVKVKARIPYYLMVMTNGGTYPEVDIPIARVKIFVGDQECNDITKKDNHIRMQELLDEKIVRCGISVMSFIPKHSDTLTITIPNELTAGYTMCVMPSISPIVISLLATFTISAIITVALLRIVVRRGIGDHRKTD